MKKGISVVIPNYNGIDLLPITLPTVYRTLEGIQLPYEVIISDDCSTDNSIDYLKKYFPQATVVPSVLNAGFSVTANRGIQSARYDIVLLLNSDVKLEQGYFDHQLQYFEKADTFGVMGRIIGWDDDIIQDGAKYPSFHSAKIKTSLNYLLENEREMEQGLYTMYISGANALIDRKKFLAIGGFNELFSPFYVEDFELSLRAWRLGWKCYYDHASVCRHKTSTTIKSKSKKTFIRMISNRNKWFLHSIHLSPGWRILWMIQLIPEVIIQAIFGKSYYLEAFHLFLSKRHQIRKSRAELLSMSGGKKLLSVKEIARTIEYSVKNKKARFF